MHSYQAAPISLYWFTLHTFLVVSMFRVFLTKLKIRLPDMVSIIQEFIQPYITSIASMETDHVLEASKDSGGQRVIEAFLSSNASAKQKRRLVMK